MSGQVILYDLPSQHKPDGSWSSFSFNPWKTRMILNFKKIPYRTEFVEYPDLEPKLKALGVPPQGKDAFAAYTAPTIQLPDGKFVVESNNCAEALESLYPEPTLRLDANLHRNIMEKVDQATGNVMPIALPTLIHQRLPERSGKFFDEDREKRWGIKIDDLAAMKGEELFQAGEAPGGSLEQIKDELHKHKKDSGPFVLGSQVSYGDFVIASLFEAFERVDKPIYDRLMAYDKSFKELHEACRPWLERDD